MILLINQITLCVTQTQTMFKDKSLDEEDMMPLLNEELFTLPVALKYLIVTV